MRVVVPSTLTDEDVRALEPVLRGCARRAISDRSVVDDLVQETLLAAIRGIDAFDGRSALRTWVVSILGRKIVDHYRRAGRWDGEPAREEQVLVMPTPSSSPEQKLADRQAMKVLDAAIRSLPSQERMAVVLCDVEEVDREEACNALGVNATHLRVILHRGRNRLRKALEDAGL